MEVSASVAARALMPLVQSVLSTVQRLHGERVAAETPLEVRTDLLEGVLRETFGRFSGGNVDDSWWQRVLSEMASEYVASDFFRKPAVRNWLNVEGVQEAFVAIARANIMGQTAADEEEIRTFLAESYSHQTGEEQRFAKVPIDAVVASLTGGYIASIPREQRSLAGMIQALEGKLVGLTERLGRRLTREPLVREALGKAAEDELSTILAQRSFDFPTAIDRVHALWRRVEDGDLADATVQARDSVRYWATRLHAVNEKTIPEAHQIRQTLSDPEAGGNPRILDALLQATEGDADGAIQLLRDESDADSRSVLLGILAHTKDEANVLAWCEEVDPTATPDFYTELGWRGWALCLARSGRWEEAAAGLRALASVTKWAPVLAMIEGVANAALLLPDERRLLTLEGPPTYSGIAPGIDEKAKEHHTRALECFAHVEKSTHDVGERVRQELANWKLWLGLMDSDSDKVSEAEDTVRALLEDGGRGIRVVALAWAFGIRFDDRALRNFLASRQRIGGLGDEDIFAECLLNQSTMSSREFATYIEERTERLDRVIQKSLTTVMLFSALLDDGQVERARTLMENHRGDLDKGSLARMETALEAARGGDPRNRLETMYAESGELIDLVNLIRYLKTVEDRTALKPLVQELFELEPTLEHALEVVGLLSQPPTDHRSVVKFLEAHPAILEASDDMQSALAWGLFHAGRVHEADDINVSLLHRRKERNDLSLDVNIAVATGDWERLATIVDREWPRRAEHDPEMLIMLARLASQGGQSTERAVELARLAAMKAPEDPHTLIAAYGIHVELGRDEEADPAWLPTALEHSSEAGPIWQADLEKVVNDWLPKLHKQNEEIERKLLEGALPMVLATGVLNTPLSRLLLDEPMVGIRDGRKRRVVPIVSGRRKPVDLRGEWTIGLDVTSVMVLARLGLLEKAIENMGHIKVASDVMGCLFSERAAVRFHQPVRVDSAKQMRRLIDGGRITLVERTVPPAQDLTEEVGRDLAMLLEASKDTGGVAICAMPIYKAKSLMEERADTSAYDDLILSPADLCAVAYRAGRVDAEKFKSAKAFMISQSQEQRESVPLTILDGPIYVDGLALSYLQSARVLEPMANSGLDLRIHPNVSEETNAFIEVGETGDDLAETVEKIRDMLRRAMESDRMSLLPRSSQRLEEGLGRVPSMNSIATLINGSSECDALCIDDRYVNNHLINESSEGWSVPVVCVLDVLRGLLSARAISEEQYWTARHNLREAGFAFVPVEADELFRHLKHAEFEAGNLLESAELRAIRQTVNRFDSLELLGEEEARTMSQGIALACVEVVRKLWSDVSIDVDVAAELANWIWQYLPVTTFLVRKDPPTGGASTPLEEFMSSRVGLLLLGPMMDSDERRTAYRQWLEWTVIAPLRPANPELIERAAVDVQTKIDGLDAYRELLGGLFLECLPEAFQERVVEENPSFASDCGLESRSVLEVEGSMRVDESDMIAAATAVFNGAGSVDISDLSGTPVKVFRSAGSESITMSWLDADGEAHEVVVPELTLLCESAEARQSTIRDTIRYLGPTALGTPALLDTAGLRKLTAQELSLVYREKSMGVTATQSRLVQRIMSGWQTNLHDLVPQQLSYWEAFCGPVPNDDDLETYFSGQLMPYRRSLIKVDVIGGLDLSCLGALRDDMSPGIWLEEIDSETVLNALVSQSPDGSPMALLGVLDVALYRVDDERFRKIAAQTVTILLDDRLGFPEGYDGYKFFEILVDFLCNHVTLVEGASKCPGFWRRMCAWMQAGLITRTSVACRALPDIEKLDQWCRENLIPAGRLRRLADCRSEPLVMGHSPEFGSLRYEVISRLGLIKARHQKAGREVPMSKEIETALSEAAGALSGGMCRAPGPMEVHIRPIEPLPKDVAERISESWTTLGAPKTLTLVARMSQFFVLDEGDRSKVDGEIELVSQRAGDVEYCEVSSQLLAASVVAAATGDTSIADRVGTAISAFAARDPRPEDVELMVHTLIQAAAVHPGEREWFEWLQDRLSELAGWLPSTPPIDCVRWLYHVLAWMGVALPVRCWPHARAQRLAAAGLESI